MLQAVSQTSSISLARFRAASTALSLVLVLLLLSAALSQAQTYKVLHSFNVVNGKDGATPSAGLTLDAQGNLYGTTVGGGMFSGGIVFKITPAGKESVLHNFGGGGDGKGPVASLLWDSSGNLYGTTFFGGGGFGAVFKLNKAGAETMLHPFNGTDGEAPAAGVIQDTAENLYGTTTSGGGNGAGIVFKLSKSGVETILYNFCSLSSCTDGFLPVAALIRDTQGDLYGTTENGGAGGFTGGVVFKLGANDKETVLYPFTGGSGGGEPVAGLIQDAAGNFYGTTMAGGNSGNGVVFELSNSGKETVLHSFTGSNDGSTPVAGLILDPAGNLYGTTKMGGKFNNGVVFKLTPQSSGKWKETVLHNFTGGNDGGQPLGGLVQDRAGNLYGTASTGGKYGYGVAFKLVP